MLDENVDAGVPGSGPDALDPHGQDTPVVNADSGDAGGAANSEQDAKRRLDAIIQGLLQIPSDQRTAAVSHLPPQQRQMILSMVEQQEMLEEGSAERTRSAGEAVSEGDLDKALRFLAPTAKQEKRDAFKFAIESTQDPATLTDDVQDQMIKKWELAGTTKEEAKNFINQHPRLTDEEKERLNGKIDESELPDMNLENDEELPQAEQEQMRADGKAMSEQLEGFSDEITQRLADTENPLSDIEKVELKARQGRINALSERFSNLFNKDGSRTVLRISSRVVFWGLVMLFFLTLIQMRWIHNSVGKWNR